MTLIQRHLLILLALVFLSSCAQETDSAAPGLEPQTNHPVASKAWCSLEKITDSVHAITRFRFQHSITNVARIDYLQISEKGKITVYPVEQNYDWDLKQGETLWDDKYTVELIDSVKGVEKLKTLPVQSNLIQSLLKTQKTLKTRQTPFRPTAAITVKYLKAFSDNPTEQTLYPCNEYSESFLVDGPVRPALEFNLFVGQSSWLKNKHKTLAQTMELSFPLQILKASDLAKSGTSWCSWEQEGPLRYFIRVLTLGKNYFIRTDLTDFLFGDQYASFLQGRVNESDIFQISEQKQYLRGHYPIHETDPSTTVRRKAMYAAIKDAKGTLALVKMNPYYPAATTTRKFDDLYFSCRDQRPLKLNPDFKKTMPRLIELQKERLRR